MKEVMEQSTDKVLQNALANGGQSITHTHACTLRVLITLYRNSLSKCTGALGYIQAANETKSYLNQTPYSYTHAQRAQPSNPSAQRLQEHSCWTHTRLTAASHHSPPSGHEVNQRAVLSPLKAYLKSLRGILCNASLLFELECDVCIFTALLPSCSLYDNAWWCGLTIVRFMVSS